MSTLEKLKKLHCLNGDTYSSAEVLGLVGRAVAEIERRDIIIAVLSKYGHDELCQEDQKEVERICSQWED